MAAPSPTPQERYRIVRHVGKGGMGTVYEAIDVRLNRTVAWKETIVETETSAKAANREAQVLANLRHSHLPKVLDHFWNGQKQILIMEFVEGEDLQTLISKRSGPFSPNDVLVWSKQLLEVLRYLHSHNPPVVHRDIKPANLKLNSVGEIILLDFGLAKGIDCSNRLSSTRSIYGYTLNYAPPEQIKGDKTSARSDLYSFAATMYHLLTAVIPLDAFTRLSGIVDNGSDPLIPIRELNARVPSGLATVLEQALSLKSENRPNDAASMLAVLRRVGAVEKIQEATPGERRIAVDQFQGQTTMVVNPPPFIHTFDEAVGTAKHPSVKVPRAVYLAGLVLAIVTGVLALYWSTSKPDVSAPAGVSKPTMILPDPYRELSNAVVSIQMTDGNGQMMLAASGFFVKNDEILTALSTIEGATAGQVTAEAESYNITSVVAIDRERSLVILKVSGTTRKPLSVSSANAPTDSRNAAVIGRKPDQEIVFAANVDAQYRKDDDLIELRGVKGLVGAAVVNERGEAIGLIKSVDDKAGTLAIPAQRIAALMKKPAVVTSLSIAGANRVLYDYRKLDSEDASQKPVSGDIERKVLSMVFGSYLTDQNQCPSEVGDSSTPEGLRELRKAGHIVPRVTSTATGSFTRAAANQVAYMVFVGECGAPHVVNWGTKRLVILEGQTVAVNLDVGDYTSIDGSYDLDSDGIGELLLSGGYMQMGESFVWAKLVDAKDGKIHVVRDFKDVVKDSCGAAYAGSTRTASAIYYTPITGRLPEYRIDQKRVKCTSG